MSKREIIVETDVRAKWGKVNITESYFIELHEEQSEIQVKWSVLFETKQAVKWQMCHIVNDNNYNLQKNANI